MKKLFYLLVALVMFAPSCTKETSADFAEKTKTVSLSLQTPVMQTRFEVHELYELNYAFYDQDGKFLEGLPHDISSVAHESGQFIDAGSINTFQKDITVTFVEGKKYYGLFWLAVRNAYSPSFKNGNVANDLKDVQLTIDYSIIDPVNRIADFDAFWACVELSTDSAERTITLKRPFAVLGIGASATDIEAALDAGVDVNSVKVEVSGVPNVFNLMDGSVSGSVTASYPWLKVMGSNGGSLYSNSIELEDGSGNKVEYNILSYSHILVGSANAYASNDGKMLVDVDFFMSEKSASSSDHSDAVTREFFSVPVQRNYRTFVLGNIITSSEAIVYTIKADASFDDEDNPIIHE